MSDTDTYCDKHKQDKRVMGGCSAHRSNWYCEECDLEREAERKIAAAGEVKMPSPFKFYIEDGKLVREFINGRRTGERTVFRNMAEICNYIDMTDKDLWGCREPSRKHQEYREDVAKLADKIKELG